MTKRLIGAAVDHARERGAAVVESYPVDYGSPSYRFMGVRRPIRGDGLPSDRKNRD